MEALAALPNHVHCKISGLTVLGQPWTLAANQPIIREAFRIFGVDRCMFASNFPVDGLKGSWDYLYWCFKKATAEMPLADRKKLFSENALRFYRISLAEERVTPKASVDDRPSHGGRSRGMG
jgi:predicted TIM-barrel fold metal-dependent hydrolase